MVKPGLTAELDTKKLPSNEIEKDIVTSISADPSTGGITFGKIVLWTALIGTAFYFGKKLFKKEKTT